MARVPVKRRKGEDPEIRWKGRAVVLEDFLEIREYVDACLQPSSAPEHLSLKLTGNFHLLRRLVRALEGSIPGATPDEIARALPTIPDPPVKPERPNGSTATSKAKRRLHERQDQYQAALAKWEQEIGRYNEQLPTWQSNHALYLELKERCGPHVSKRKILKRLLEDLDRVIARGGIVFEQVAWQILPPGDSISVSVNRYLTAVRARHPTRRFDSSRITRVTSLKPTKAYVSQGEFDGYVVFLFDRSPQAVLECPWVGNALYLLSGNWTELSKLPKSTLLDNHHRQVRRIIHDEGGSWFDELVRLLKAGTTRQ
jgi:hypothetical protein